MPTWLGPVKRGQGGAEVPAAAIVKTGNSATTSAVRPRLRILEVAKQAGVSPATVSRVLNGSANVGAAKRKKVLAAVSELGYRPNRTASNLRRQQAQMIGVVISDIENPHFTQMVRAVEDAAYRRGYRVVLCNTDEDRGEAARLFRCAGGRTGGRGHHLAHRSRRPGDKRAHRPGHVRCRL